MYGIKLETADVRMGFYDYSAHEMQCDCMDFCMAFQLFCLYGYEYDCDAILVLSARRICPKRAWYLYCARISVSNIDISQNSNESSNNFFILMAKHFGFIWKRFCLFSITQFNMIVVFALECNTVIV